MEWKEFEKVSEGELELLEEFYPEVVSSSRDKDYYIQYKYSNGDCIFVLTHFSSFMYSYYDCYYVSQGVVLASGDYFDGVTEEELNELIDRAQAAKENLKQQASNLEQSLYSPESSS